MNLNNKSGIVDNGGNGPKTYKTSEIVARIFRENTKSNSYNYLPDERLLSLCQIKVIEHYMPCMSRENLARAKKTIAKLKEKWGLL